MGLEPIVPGTPAQEVPAAPVETQAPAAPAPDEKSTQRFVELAKRERQAQAMRNQLKAEQARVKEMESKYQTYEQAKAQARLNPLEYLKQAGLTPEDLVQFQLNNGAPTPDLQFQQLKQELEQTKRELQEKDQQRQQQSEAQRQQDAQRAVEGFKEEIGSFIQEKPEEYELTLAAMEPADAIEMIYGVIDLHWQQSVERYEASGHDPKLKPKVLSKEEAAGLVEKDLEAKVEKVLSGKKLGSKYKKIEEAVAEVAKDIQQDKFIKTTQEQAAPVKPLHNGLATSALPRPTSGLTIQQKMERAAALMKGKSP